MNRQEHLLTIFSEECAEVIQAVSKTLRFGPNEVYPKIQQTNIERVREEYNQLVAMKEMLQAEGLDIRPDYKVRADKKEKVEHYLEYSRECGTLD